MKVKTTDKAQFLSDAGDLQKLYCNGGVLAQAIGLTQRQIQNLQRDNIVSSDEVPTTRRKGYHMYKAISSYCEYLRNRASGRASTDKEAELKQKKLEVDIALKESQNELHRLKTDIQAGRYISVEEVQSDYEQFFVILKKFVLSMPSRVGVLINGYLSPEEVRQIEHDISKELQGMLNNFVSSAINTDTLDTIEKENTK